MKENLFFDRALLSYSSQQLVNRSWRTGFSIVLRQTAGFDGGKLTAAICMPLQALFPDEMINNDTKLIALNSNHDDVFGAFKISEFGVVLLSCYSFVKPSLFKTN